MLIASKILGLMALLLLILCMGAGLEGKPGRQNSPVMKKIRGSHTLYAILLLAAGLIHGIAAGKEPGMLTGKIAWMVLLVLVILSLATQKRRSGKWKKIHRYLGIAVCLLVAVHVVYAILV